MDGTLKPSVLSGQRLRLQNSRIFCERERTRFASDGVGPSSNERSGASVQTARENGERRLTRPAGV